MRTIFKISVEDVQSIANKKLRRKLTLEELKVIKKGVECGLEYWEEIVGYAIDELKNITITKKLGIKDASSNI